MKCKKHGDTAKIFYPTGRRPRCSQCAVDSVTKRRRKLKIMAVDSKGGKCERCQYNKCIGALHFHHKDPAQKDFTLAHGGITRGWAAIQTEIEKCLLLCANCHAEIHAEQVGDSTQGECA